MENDSGTFRSIRQVLEKVKESLFQCPTFYLWANSLEAVLFVMCIRTVHWFGSLEIVPACACCLVRSVQVV